MHEALESAVTIIGFIVGVAIVALLISPKATTSSVIQASASGLGNVLGVAESPVTGANIQYNLSYPAGNGGGFSGNTNMLPDLQLGF